MKGTTTTLPFAAAAAIDTDKLEKSAVRAATLLKAMANAHRLRILCQLADGEKAVGEMEAVIGLSQSALSQHLMLLRREGVVTTRREAQSIYYSLASKEAQAVILTLYEAFCAPRAIKRKAKKAR
jgi:DNA-binding transcriptional ArsR family regulator